MTTALPRHYFRTESARLLSALARVFGVHNLALAEDVAQEALVRALEVWKVQGVPDNPSAWLYRSAKNIAVDALRKERTARTYAPDLSRWLESEWTRVSTLEDAFEPHAVVEDAQVALVLHLSCGFSIGEIAAAFFASPAAIAKRITRAKAKLMDTRSLFDLKAGDAPARLGAVRSAIYLLFNEGYHGSSPESAVRDELCHEALRLVTVLAEHAQTSQPETNALAALLFLHASRLPARVSQEGRLRSLFEQDRATWDRALIARGLSFLERSADGPTLTEYHVEAAIAAHHATASSREATPWRSIVELYDILLSMRPSPVVALSRAIAIAECEGPACGLAEMQTIEGRERLSSYPFYEAALGELNLRAARHALARTHFEAAALLARNEMERVFFEARKNACG